jgi:hypothetical protein
MRTIFFITALVSLMISYYYTKHSIDRSKESYHRENNNCERYLNWAWIHAPRSGLVSEVNDLDEP